MVADDLLSITFSSLAGDPVVVAIQSGAVAGITAV
jgi:hypothetical protein